MSRITAGVVLAALGFAAGAQAAEPNLKATHVSPPPKRVAEHTTFKVVDQVANAGAGKAGRSVVRYYLTTDPARSFREREDSRTNPRTALADIPLEGARTVRALKPGQKDQTRSKRRTKVRVPLGTPAGEYVLLACADDRGAVAETKEADNCVASKRVEVTPGIVPIDVAFGDWLADESDADLEADLTTFKPLACAPGPGGGPLSLKRALGNIDRFLKAKAPQGVQRFKASPDYRDADKAEAAAAGALLASTPAAALAATTRAHRLEPKEASHLVNTAGVATSVGLAREALALLDASLRLDDKVPSAWGINRQALALTNRAHALAALGRFAEADRAAEAAEAIEPTLTEAATTSSIASLCQDDIAKAVKKRRKAQRRTPPPPIDESAGTEMPLRKIQLPGFPSEAERFKAYYPAQSQRLLDEIGARNDREAAHETALRDRHPDPLSERQGGRLLSAVYAAHETPALRAQWDEIDRLDRELVDYMIRFFCHASDCEPENHYYDQFAEEASEVCEGDPRTNCYAIEMNARCRPALKPYHQGWLSRMETLHAKNDAYIRALSKRMSAIAANIGDPDRFALAMLQIEGLESAHYSGLVGHGHWWTQDIRVRADHCVDPVPDEGSPADPAVAAAAGSPCTSATKPLNVVLDVGPGALKLNCEELQFEADTGGWLAGFGEVAYDHKAGTITVFAGSKGSLGVPGLKGEFKSGIYVRVGNDGFQDVGWRVGPQATVGGGPVEYAPKAEMDMSFVGAFSGGAR
jgi:tetratricopeptide (TPR) repeat protein